MAIGYLPQQFAAQVAFGKALKAMHHFARSLVPAAARHFLPQTLKRVVVIGGGPTGLFCADRLRHHFEVTVVDSKEYFEFTPSVLRAIVDPIHLARITFDYREVLEGTLGVEFVLGEASSVDVSAMHNIPGRGAVAVKGAGAPSKLYFDYCVVAVGVSNGLWKPNTAPEPSTSNPAGFAASGTTPSAVSTVMEIHDERTLPARRRTLRSLREHVAASRGVVVVGAGLVGVELAAELVHFFPQLKVTLVDGAPDVLPQLGEGAREYARNWLRQHNVTLRLGTPFVPGSVGENQVVLSCVGARSRSAGLFSDPSAFRPNGQLRANRHMQVLGAGASGGVEPLGQGRIFAVGDAVAVEGVPTAQMIFHGEEMAAVAVANIEAAEDVASPLALTKSRREMEPQQPFLCCTSLGPHDGMFSTQTELVATGPLAAMQKQMIETTKMGALKGDFASALVWYPVH